MIRRSTVAWCTFVLLSAVALPAAADIGSKQIGVPNGDDWEAAIAADGQNIYVYWPHYIFAGTTPPVTVASNGVTCPAPSNVWDSYMYFQRSSDGGATWGPISIPRCPINGNVVDAQIVVGPNHRIFIANMDGASSNTPIYVNYSDDFGATWHTPVNIAPSTGGDHPEMVVDSAGGVMVGSEYSNKNITSTNTIGYIANIASPVVVLRTVVPPASIVVPKRMSGTSLFTGTGIDSHGNQYYALADAMGTTKAATGKTYFWLARSTDHFATYTTSQIDFSETQQNISGEGWDYFGGNIQMAILPRPGQANDRIITLFNAGNVAQAPERIYTRYSDDLGVTWSPRIELTTAPAGTMHAFPSLAAISGMVKVLWQDNRVSPTCTSGTSCGVWNNYTRSSTDGIAWAPEIRIAATSVLAPHSYLVTTPAPGGFLHPYGDYTAMATDGLGNFVNISGEGPSYAGPGGIYFAKF